MTGGMAARLHMPGAMPARTLSDGQPWCGPLLLVVVLVEALIDNKVVVHHVARFQHGFAVCVRRLVVVPIIAEIVEADVVELLVALGGVGFCVNVCAGGPAEPVPSLVFPACRQQRIRVGVIEPRVLRPDPLAGEFGTLQGNDGCLKQALIPADARFDNAQLDLRVMVRGARVRASDDIQGAVQAAKSALAVRHQRQVTAAAGQPARGTELRKGGSPVARLIRRDRAGFADHADSGGKTASLLGIPVRLFRILGDARCHQKPRDNVGKISWQRPKLGEGLGVELVGRDAVRHVEA
jgi:hypothetical protein